jgi:hypothetical protein
MQKEILKLLKESPMDRMDLSNQFPGETIRFNHAFNALIMGNKLNFIDGLFSVTPKKSKYNNKRVEIDGYKFDSIKESNRYLELILLQTAGKISKLNLQPKFKICDESKWEGKKLRERYYIADFMYMEDGERIVEDVKSSITAKNPVYTLKKQLFLVRNPMLVFREV